ncbi:NTF2-like protein [Hysterangium stoloniferum]|nr:NTF2-like protein [Hysterangium stoloniferum]
MAPTFYDPKSPEEHPVSLPSAPLVKLRQNFVLQPPLSRRGHGPGLVAFLPNNIPDNTNNSSRDSIPTSLDPEPVQKWAEESFAVVGITYSEGEDIKAALELAISTLINLSTVDIKDKIGILEYLQIGPLLLVYEPSVLASVLAAAASEKRISCVVSYGASGSGSENSVPLLCHIPDTDNTTYTTGEMRTFHKYATAGRFFVCPQSGDYNAGAAAVSHTRSLVFLRKHIGGPYFDLEAIWDEHTYFEFEVRSVAKTMGTMVAEPYVNHVPTMTGGIGREKLSAFYRDHFIFSNPPDTALEPVSRTVGADRIIDEFIFKLTHDRVVDWLLPGVPPSGKKMAIPMISVVNVRGDRLCHEHIWWDQAGALKQAGVLPSHLSYPHPYGSQLLRLPVAGIEAARLLADETDGKSNEMMGYDWGISNA